MLWHYKGRDTPWNADEAKDNSSDLQFKTFVGSTTYPFQSHELLFMDFILLDIYQQNYIFCTQFQDMNLSRRYLA